MNKASKEMAKTNTDKLKIYANNKIKSKVSVYQNGTKNRENKNRKLQEIKINVHKSSINYKNKKQDIVNR